MPSDIQSDRFSGLLIGEIMKLLKYQRPECDVEVLRWTPKIITKLPCKFANRKLLQQIITKNASPALFEETPLELPTKS